MPVIVDARATTVLPAEADVPQGEIALRRHLLREQGMPGAAADHRFRAERELAAA